MPSLADIPTEHLRPDHKIEFLNWVSKLPGNNNIKRTLINLWSRETGVSVSFHLRTQVNMGMSVEDEQ